MHNKNQKSLPVNPIVPLRLPSKGGAQNARQSLIKTAIYAYYYQWVPDDGLISSFLILDRNNISFSRYKLAAILGMNYETLCLHTYG